MKFFDVALRADLRTEGDLANLTYFGLAGAVVVPDDGAPSDDAVRVEERFRDTLRAVDRLRSDHGVVCSTALGLRASSAPRRAHPELQDSLRRHASSGALAAVGAVEWPDNSGAFEWQLRVAADHSLPLQVEIAGRSGEEPVRRLAEYLRGLEFEAPAVSLIGCDFTNVRAAAAAGFWIVADLSPGGLGWEAGADLAERYGDRIASRMMLSISSHASFDVLAAARFAERIRGGKLKPGSVEGILWANANSLFPPR